MAICTSAWKNWVPQKLPWVKNLTIFPQFSSRWMLLALPLDGKCDGNLFCFLQLPTKTGACWHLHGFFELSSNRRGLVRCFKRIFFTAGYRWPQVIFFSEMIFETTFSFLFIFWSSIFNTQNVDDTVSEPMLNEVEAMFVCSWFLGVSLRLGSDFWRLWFSSGDLWDGEDLEKEGAIKRDWRGPQKSPSAGAGTWRNGALGSFGTLW